jgi:hypothetical protein
VGRRLPTAGTRLRAPWLPVRGRPSPGPHEEPDGAQGQGEGEDWPPSGRQPRADPRRPQPDASGSVWLLQTSNSPRQPCSASSTASSAAGCVPSCASTTNAPALDAAPPTINAGQRVLRASRLVHPSRSLRAGETLPMGKPTTGEPYAGEPHVRFGGRRGLELFPPPIGNLLGLAATFPVMTLRRHSACLCNACAGDRRGESS